MRVDNIFELVNKFSKKEDQLSAGFGFILKNHPRILRKFLNSIGLNLKPRELKEGFPELIEHSQRRGQSLEGTHKHYVFGEITPLAREIPHLKGEGSKAQVYFQTKLSELLRVHSVGEIRTLEKLEKV